MLEELRGEPGIWGSCTGLDACGRVTVEFRLEFKVYLALQANGRLRSYSMSCAHWPQCMLLVPGPRPGSEGPAHSEHSTHKPHSGGCDHVQDELVSPAALDSEQQGPRQQETRPMRHEAYETWAEAKGCHTRKQEIVERAGLPISWSDSDGGPNQGCTRPSTAKGLQVRAKVPLCGGRRVGHQGEARAFLNALRCSGYTRHTSSAKTDSFTHAGHRGGQAGCTGCPGWALRSTPLTFPFHLFVFGAL